MANKHLLCWEDHRILVLLKNVFFLRERRDCPDVQRGFSGNDPSFLVSLRLLI